MKRETTREKRSSRHSRWLCTLEKYESTKKAMRARFRGGARRVGRRQQRRRVGVSEILGHDGRLEDDFVVDLEGRHEPARVDLEVPRVTRAVERDDDLLKGDLELRQGDVGAVGPWRTRLLARLPW